jgi:DNA-binding winged helix-turn-helix (wHTH) protein
VSLRPIVDDHTCCTDERGPIAWPFSLVPSERLLPREGVPVEVGPRTLDVLIALVCRSYEAISKKDLLAQVWPEAIVEEGSPRFHIANLRWATEKEGHDISRIWLDAATASRRRAHACELNALLPTG